jgi:drug/metabolite transporter (DMT)-like permease
VHPLSIALVLLSAVAHVGWNLQVKRSPQPSLYTWWLQITGAALLLPLALWRAWPFSVPPAGWACVAGTGLIYVGYYSLIALSYRREDLSRAYPIARGVAPLGTAALGVLVHREHPSLPGWLGILAISLGVFFLAFPAERKGVLRLAGVLAAVGVGLCTAAYSAVDKAGVRQVDPALYFMLTNSTAALGLGLLLSRRHEWRDFAAEAGRGGPGLLGAAMLSVGGYVTVLYVLRTEPVSYVVAIRSVAVLLSVLAGTRLLGEADAARRLGAGALIVLGIGAIAVGG